MAVTYSDIVEGRQFEIEVCVRECRKATKSKRAFELQVEDRDGVRIPFIVWEKSTVGSAYDWREDHWYELSGVRANVWDSGKVLHGTSALQIRHIGPDRSTDASELIYMTDSHLGTTRGGYGQTYPVDPMPGFRTVIDAAIAKDVDGVIHGGDLFHNPGGGIPDSAVRNCRSQIERLSEAGIPFYFIYGNHERTAGREVMGSYIQNGLATHLDASGVLLNDSVAVYGLDFDSEFDGVQLNFTSYPTASTRILCVHQSVPPFGGGSVSTSVSDLITAASPPFDIVLVGHTHTYRQETYGSSLAIAGGATARLGRSKKSLAPSYEHIHIKRGEFEVDRIEFS